MPNIPLLTTATINTLLQDNENTLEDFEFTLWGVLHWFFDNIHQQAHKDICFTDITDVHYLEQVRSYLITYRDQTTHKYKKLHYTYLISKITDRLLELQSIVSKPLNSLEKISHIVQPWDIVLISYYSHGFSWDSFLNNLASNALRLFSHSIFAHVWLVGYSSDTNWYRWLHSTLHNDDGRRGVKKILLNLYLPSNAPCDILVMRYKNWDKQLIDRMIHYGDDLVQKKTWYDQWDAIEDITWTSFFRKDNQFNCAEFVYSCLRSISPLFVLNKKWLPASYVDTDILEQVYLTKFHV